VSNNQRKKEAKKAYIGYVLFLFVIIIGIGAVSSAFADHFLSKFGSGQLGYVHDIVVDSSGNIYVSDGENSRIQKFNSNGKFLLQWGVVNPPEGSAGTPGVEIGAMV